MEQIILRDYNLVLFKKGMVAHANCFGILFKQFHSAAFGPLSNKKVYAQK